MRKDYAAVDGSVPGKPRNTDFDPRKAAVPATAAIPVMPGTTALPVTHDSSKATEVTIIDVTDNEVVAEVTDENGTDVPPVTPEDTKPAKKPKKK